MLDRLNYEDGINNLDLGNVEIKGETFKIQITSDLLQLFEAHGIWQHRTHNGVVPENKKRWSVGKKLELHKTTTIEEHVTFQHGFGLCSAGSFCEILSPLPVNAQLGRFISIAGGGNLLGYRHPIEKPFMSSAALHITREYLHSYQKEIAKRGKSLSIKPTKTAQPHRTGLLIGHDVWIGERVTLRGGISIGNGAVVAADTVVTKDVPPYAVVGGNPGEIIKYRFEQGLINLLEHSQWWNYELYELHKLDISNVKKFAEEIIKKKDELEIYKPKKLNIWKLYEQNIKT